MNANIENKAQVLFAEMQDAIFYSVYRSRDDEGYQIIGIPEAAKRASVLACLYAKKFNPIDFGEICQTIEILEVRPVATTYANKDIEHRVQELFYHIESILESYLEDLYEKDKHKKLVKGLATTAYRFAEMNGLDMSYARIYTTEVVK